MATISCSACGRKLVRPEAAGRQKFRCPRCNAVMEVTPEVSVRAGAPPAAPTPAPRRETPGEFADAESRGARRSRGSGGLLLALLLGVAAFAVVGVLSAAVVAYLALRSVQPTPQVVEVTAETVADAEPEVRPAVRTKVEPTPEPPKGEAKLPAKAPMPPAPPPTPPPAPPMTPKEPPPPMTRIEPPDPPKSETNPKLDPPPVIAEEPLMPTRAGAGFAGRRGATREKLLAEGGGNAESEAAVARGLAWLAKQQKADGSWMMDGTNKFQTTATAFALLAYLGAGHTHKPLPGGDARDRQYAKVVDAGLKYLRSKQKATGDFGVGSLYDHAVVAMALCEAYGMTFDSQLRTSAQRAIDYILRAQHSAGGWRYSPGQAGDTSVVGWQVQALKAAKLAGLNVPATTIANAQRFLDSVAAGTPQGSTYGYTERGNGPATTAAGLLSRMYLGWSRQQPAVAAGVAELKKRPPPSNPRQGRPDIYYYYYATLVVFFRGGEDWQAWNPHMRDWLVATQVKEAGPNDGSWEKDQSFVGAHGGRMLTTCLNVMTLEVYYRHLPLYRTK